MNVTKFNKQFTIGELDFTISINRAIAYEAFAKYPQYYNAIIKHQELINLVTKEKEKNKNISAKQMAQNIASTIDNNSFEEIVAMLETKETLDLYGEKIVDYCFAKLLEYSETELPENINTYEEYKTYIFDYCKENEVFYDYETEEDEAEQGLVSLVMEFVLMGFTQGNTQRKSKLKITTK